MKQLPRNKRIGITGGIGSGKSVLASLLEVYGIPVYIADVESKRLTNESPIIREGLTDLFGESLYTDAGLDKRKLASFIFTQPDNLKKVNAIIHPVVGDHFRRWVDGQETPYCAMESAILFESGFDRCVDTTLMVYAPLELRIARVQERDQFSREEILKRIRNQLSDEIKKERADYVIYNDGHRALIPQVEAFLATLGL
ncbi:dephospho-CoA kinase [Parabacteroides sp. Marseille-P3160]|uniref:dephospho-CoA kinase n=1 Tax=Parabacteroides sp. Marseille-P3160 TaxID=1917887 RepID=UPI0009B9B4F7|nr:dephospho-CoA kinase [Parabacteroides sp. Marseille-P3160]